MSAGLAPGVADARLAFPDLRARTLDGVLLEMAVHLGAAGVVGDPGNLAQRLLAREGEGCTGVNEGIAFPHCRLEALAEVVLAVGVSRAGVDFGAADGVPVTLLFLVLSPREAPALHLQALARVTRLARMPGVPDRLRHAGSAEAILRALRETEAAAAVPAAP